MILGVPTLCRYDLLDKLLDSVLSGSRLPERVVIIDNGGAFTAEGCPHSFVHVERQSRNIGVSASWNRILELAGDEPVVITNDDVILGPDTLLHFEHALTQTPMVIADSVGMALFGLTREGRDALGWFDENFWPAYYEDIDYHRRAALRGIRTSGVPAPLFHGVASTRNYLDGEFRSQYIHDGFTKNAAYYAQKWGGPQGAETFRVPFDGHPPEGWKERV